MPGCFLFATLLIKLRILTGVGALGLVGEFEMTPISELCVEQTLASFLTSV